MEYCSNLDYEEFFKKTGNGTSKRLIITENLSELSDLIYNQL